MADEELSDEEQMARMRAALGIEDVPQKKPAAKKPAAKKPAAKKPAAKKPVKQAAPRKHAAKKVPAKKPAKKAAPRKRVPAKKKVITPEELTGVDVTKPPEPGEIMAVYVDELADPAMRAHMLWIQGVPMEEIAVRTGYVDARGASAAIAAWMQRGAFAEGTVTAAARARLSMDTTQLVKSAFWDQAMQGDKDAAALVLQANRDFFKFAGLEKADLSIRSERTIVISGGETMGAELKAAALAQDEAMRRADEEGVVTDVGEDVG